jgi:hypothetical protein
MQGCLMLLESYGIAMLSNRRFVYVIHSFSFINTDNSFTFNTPVDVNKALRSRRISSLERVRSKQQPQTDPNEVEFYSQNSQLLEFSEEDKDICDNAVGFTPPRRNGDTIYAVLSQPFVDLNEEKELESSNEACLAMDNLISSDVVLSLREERQTPMSTPSSQRSSQKSISNSQSPTKQNLLSTLTNPTLAGVISSSPPATITESLQQLLQPTQNGSPSFTPPSNNTPNNTPPQRNIPHNSPKNLQFGYDVGLNTQEATQFANHYLDEDEMMEMLEGKKARTENSVDRDSIDLDEAQFDKEYAGSPELFSDDDDKLDELDEEIILLPEEEEEDEVIAESPLRNEEPVVQIQQPQAEKLDKKKKKRKEYDEELEDTEKPKHKRRKTKVNFAYKSARPRLSDYMMWMRYI